MFNSHTFNSRLFNGSFTNNTVYSTDRLVFEGFSLSDGDSMVMTDFPGNGPTRELIGGPIPRGNGDYVTGDRYGDNVLEAAGIAKKDSAAELAAFLKTIQRNLRKLEGNLDVIDDDGVIRRYKATLINYEELFSGRRHYHINICPWRVQFVCKNPFGRTRDYSSTSFSMTTTTTQSIVNMGTEEAQPVITLIFNEASSVTDATVTNNTTGESITYTGAIAANDILVFDSELKEVRLNGTKVNFSGAFVALDVGANLIEVEVTGTSYKVYATISHRDTYH